MIVFAGGAPSHGAINKLGDRIQVLKSFWKKLGKHKFLLQCRRTHLHKYGFRKKNTLGALQKSICRLQWITNKAEDDDTVGKKKVPYSNTHTGIVTCRHIGNCYIQNIFKKKISVELLPYIGYWTSKKYVDHLTTWRTQK